MRNRTVDPRIPTVTDELAPRRFLKQIKTLVAAKSPAELAGFS